jgi:uncharacterized protein (TIGR02996 family)
MTDGYALLRAIEANPDEDTPRLAYADWLDENGQPERAEFIRLQCELARLPSRPRPDGLVSREGKLFGEFHERWLRELPGQQFYPKFRRGFIDPVHTGGFNVVRHWETYAAVAPLHHLHLFKTPLMTDKIAACPALRFVRWLNLASNVIRNAAIAALARSPHLVNVNRLEASQNHIGVAGCAALAGADLPALRRLDLNFNPVKDRGLTALLAAAWMPGLTSLCLSRCGLTDRGVIALAESPAVGGLRELWLGAMAATDAGVRALVDSPHLRRLERIWIDYVSPVPAAHQDLRSRFGDRLNPRSTVPYR